MIITNDNGSIKTITFAVCAVSWAFAAYFLLYGQSVEAPVFLFLFGSVWLLISVYNARITIDAGGRKVVVETRLGSITVKREEFDFDKFGAILIRSWSRAGNGGHIGHQADDQCFLAWAEHADYFRAQHERMQQSMGSAKSRDEMMSEAMLHLSRRMRGEGGNQDLNPGLMLKDVKPAQRQDCIEVAEYCAEITGYPIYDLTPSRRRG